MTQEISQPMPPCDRTDRFAGILLGATALLSLAVIMHHPALRGAPGAVETAGAIHALAGTDRLVHGALMLLFALQAIGFHYFSTKLGLRKPAALAGLVAYEIGVGAMIVAATFDGFVTPDLADACLASVDCGALQPAIMTLVGVAIQDFTKIGLAAMSLATLCWSTALVGRPGIAPRITALIGAICGIAPLFTVAVSGIHLRPGNLAGIMLAQVVWSLAAAITMIGRGHPVR